MSAALARESLELVDSAGSVHTTTLFLIVLFSAAADISLCIRFLGIAQLFRVSGVVL